jgi:peptide-methionine (S)-S-oxide reductase
MSLIIGCDKTDYNICFLGAIDMSNIIYFGAGCFWGVEENFRTTPGVLSTEVGYGGGVEDNPSYQLVCSGNTKHVELVKVEFDPKLLSLEKLVERFFSIHDPTTLNRQGPDIGHQYRSVIYCVSPDDLELAQNLLDQWQMRPEFQGKIVTTVEPFLNYYRAEDYHQKYAQRNGWSCAY